MNFNKTKKMEKDFRKFYKGNNPFGMTAFDDIMKKGVMVPQMITPYILEERTMNVTQMDIFSRLMSDRIIFFGETVTSDVCNIVVSQLLFMENVNDEAPITMYINSGGGSVYDGLSVIDTMNFINPEVSTTCTGMAASMGAMLLLSGEKGKRSALKHSRIMLHEPSTSIPRSTASDIEIEWNEISKIKKELFEMISECTGQKYEKVVEDCKRDFWMSSQAAKDYGIIDNIICKEAKKKK